MNNFGAGPGAMPEAVKQRVIERLKGSVPGSASALEVSDRSPEGGAILREARALIRSLLQVPDEFSVLLVPGGGTHQFVSLAYTLREIVGRIQFVITDYWGARAQAETANLMQVETIYDGAADRFRHLPHPLEISKVDASAAVFFTSNNTTAGTQWPRIPRTRSACTIVDMSSDIFARTPDYEQVDVVMACAQKQFGVAGISIMLIRNTLLKQASSVGGYLSLGQWHASEGVYNTFPMVLAVIAVECLRYLAQIGIAAVAQTCQRCSDHLYAYLDASLIFKPRIDDDTVRSRHNVSFAMRQSDPEVLKHLLALAGERNLLGLKGHPSVGGLRASFYYGASEQATTALIDFLSEMEHEVLHGTF